MTRGVSIGKDAAVSGSLGGTRPRQVSVWSGSARRKQRDHGAAVCLLQDGGRGGCGCFSWRGNGTPTVLVSGVCVFDTEMMVMMMRRQRALPSRAKVGRHSFKKKNNNYNNIRATFAPYFVPPILNANRFHISAFTHNALDCHELIRNYP